MPRVMKPPTDYDANAVDTGGDYYDGPPPTPGVYRGTVKKMLLTKVSEGDKKGEQRIMVLCEISEGKFKGAGVSKWLQLTNQGSPWLNQFLHSLTDGSEEAKKRVRAAFKSGYTVDDPDDKKRLPIVKIGKVKVIGMPCSFVTKLRTGTDDVTRAEIARFVVPFNASDDDEDVPETALDDDDDPMSEFAGDDDDTAEDGNTDAEDNSEEDTDTEDDSSSSDDDDDPWSVGQ